MSDPKQENNPKDMRPGESLSERSARLEAEAAAMYDAQNDPMAVPNDVDPADVDETQSDDVRLEIMQEELDKAKDQMMRALAEAENARKRAAKERQDATKFAIAGFARDMLDVADNLRRALDAVPADLPESDERVKNLMGGIEATERVMLASFEKNGIKKVEPLDQPFDPNFHEVMFETPGTGKPAGTVIQVIESGYILNERILRPARVGVAKGDGQGGAGGASTPPEAGGAVDTEA